MVPWEPPTPKMQAPTPKYKPAQAAPSGHGQKRPRSPEASPAPPPGAEGHPAGMLSESLVLLTAEAISAASEQKAATEIASLTGVYHRVGGRPGVFRQEAEEDQPRESLMWLWCTTEGWWVGPRWFSGQAELEELQRKAKKGGGGPQQPFEPVAWGKLSKVNKFLAPERLRMGGQLYTPHQWPSTPRFPI